MKALRIIMTAFGPFAGEEVVDFEEIAGATLLLIHGPTGSGKTTILDAICFALFADTSGAEREGRQMRCDGAAADLATSVRYEFALGSKKYCVERRPEQTRPAKRGGGTTTDGHKATLWDQSKVSSPDDEGKVLASGAAKVKKAVVDLFGFDSDQFRQVVMLPQGQFRKLLTAESKDKEKILQKLFQTSHYLKLERTLADRSSKMRRAFENDQVAMETLLVHEEASTVEELVAKIASAAQEHTQLAEALPEFKSKSEVANALLAKARADELLLDEHAAALAVQRDLKSRDSEVEALRARLTSIQLALPLIPRADSARARQQEAALAEAALVEADLELAACAEAKRLATEVLEAQNQEADKTEALRKEAAALEAMAESVRRLDEMRAKSDALGLLIKDQVSEQEEAAEEERALKSALTLTKKSKDADETQSARLEALELGLRSDRLALKKRTEHERAELAWQKAVRAHEEVQETLAKARRRIEELEGRLAGFEKAWQAGQAGALARDLSEGQACPVCGSEEHPKPAAAGDSLPSQEEIEQAREALREAREEHALLQEQEASARADVASEKLRMSDLAKELGEATSRELSAWQKELAEQEAQVEAARAAKRRAAEAGEAVVSAERALEGGSQRLAALTDAVTEKRIEFASVSGSAQELESKVPAHLRPPGSLALAKAKAAEELEERKRALEEAQRATKTASEAYAASEARSKSAASSAAAAAAKASEAAKQFESHRSEAGFADEASFQRAAAETEQAPAWEEQIKKHEGEGKAAADRVERAALAAKGKERTDIAALTTLADAAATALELEIGRETDAKNQHERLQKTHKEHDEIQKRVAVQQGEWRLVASVSDLANGKVPPKVSFQRFVLGALLDEVLSAASERLSRMTEGRYRMQRQLESQHKGKASGLDLEVMDAYSGTPRPVSTLSGGESFLAALGLSLGLADVVQRFSGGIRLDTLLIDEGFGTLDSDALDLALDTLTGINSDGRLVGIISHVDELRSRISTRLEVTKGVSGSTTRFVGS